MPQAHQPPSSADTRRPHTSPSAAAEGGAAAAAMSDSGSSSDSELDFLDDLQGLQAELAALRAELGEAYLPVGAAQHLASHGTPVASLQLLLRTPKPA